jgi:hypothetical protein
VPARTFDGEIQEDPVTAVSSTIKPLRVSLWGAILPGVSGVLVFVLGLSRVFLTGEVDAPALLETDQETITAFYQGLTLDGNFTLGVGMVAVATVMYLVWASKITELLRDLGDVWRWIANLFMGGVMLEIVLSLGYIASFAAAVSAASNGLDVESYLALHWLGSRITSLAWITVSAWLTPLGVASVRTGLFPKWLGWAMLLAVVGNLAAFFVSVPVAAERFSGVLVYLSVLVTSIVLLARSDRYLDLESRSLEPAAH